MPKIHAPNHAFKGVRAGVTFVDGVGETTDPSALAFFRRSGGYQIGRRAGVPDAIEQPPDPREHAEPHKLGTPLRDAAVDPRPTDFLPPINAGEANPHGSHVVAPGLHAVGPKPIRPGEVFVDDTDKQAAEETALATAVLVEGQLATVVAEDAGEETDLERVSVTRPKPKSRARK